MFSKQEMAILKQQFWTSFGQYMTPVPSAEGFKINWVNYKTGVKDLHFKMLAGSTAATISIVMAHAATSRQTLFFNQFMRVKNVLQDALQEDWQWALHVPDENNKTVSCMYTSLTGVNIFKKEDWPAIISFFKPRMIALDSFWTKVKFGFETV